MRSRQITFAGTGVELAGSLLVPEESRSWPGVVLIGGSGPSDRHNDGFFDALAAHLVRSGVAVLAYDKRGAGMSTGSWQTASLESLAADARCALAVMRADPRVRSGSVGVLGHSEGGWVALHACARDASIPFVILNSCPAVSFLDAEVFALIQAGVPRADAAMAGDLIRSLAGAARAGEGYERAEQIIAAVRKDVWFASIEEAGFALDPTSWAQIGEWGDYDPLGDLLQLSTPTLVALGADDPLVPVDASVGRYEETARNTGRVQDIAIFPGADHRLRIGAAGDPAPDYLARLAEWTTAGHRSPDGR